MDTNRSFYVRVADGREHCRRATRYTTKQVHRDKMWMYRVRACSTTVHRHTAITTANCALYGRALTLTTIGHYQPYRAGAFRLVDDDERAHRRYCCLRIPLPSALPLTCVVGV